MKIKNLKLMLLGLLAMGSMNTFAREADWQWAVKDGIRYQYNPQEDIAESKAFSATVYGLTAASTTVAIPAEFSTTDENSITLKFKVTRFEENWTTATPEGTDAKKQRVDATGITSLTINVTNFIGDQALQNAGAGLTALETLVITGGAKGAITPDDPATADVDESSPATFNSVDQLMPFVDAMPSLKTVDIYDTGIESVGSMFSPGVTSENWHSLTSLKLPKGLTTIPDNAFKGSKITSFVGGIPATVSTIGNYAFSESELPIIDLSGTAITALPTGCFYKSKLQTITLPDEGFTKIGDSAFENCEGLTAFTFGGDLETIGASAFKGTGLTDADLSDTKVKEISQNAFNGSALETVILPDNLTLIGASAFKATALTTVTIPAKAAIAGYAFADCSDLAEVLFAEGATLRTISAGAFRNTALTSIELPESVTAINTEAFKGTKFTEFTFNGKTVAESAFESCTSLKTFNFAADEETTEGYDINYYAFVGCNYPVTIKTTQLFADTYKVLIDEHEQGEEDDEYAFAPLNCEFEPVETPEPDPEVLDPIKTYNGFAKWFDPVTTIAIDPRNAKVFSVYVDNKGDGTIYFQSLKLDGGMYIVNAGEHVIIQSLDTEAEGVEYEIAEGGVSVLIDEVFTFTAAQKATVVKFQKKEVKGYSRYVLPVEVNEVLPEGDITFQGSGYNLYRLTNKNGIGFSQYTGTTLAEGQFFVQSKYQADAEGRAKVVWLDEDGNVIDGAATAIQSVKTAAEVGAIYNVAGQKVGASYKGLVIKGGKKYIQK